MTPPKQLMEAAEKPAGVYCFNEHHQRGDNKKYFAFIEGVEWLFGHLCELSEQEITLDDLAGDYSAGAEEQRVFNEGKRRQHTLDHAALLKARERIAELERYESGYGRWESEQVSELKEELEAAKQEIARLRKLDEEHIDELSVAMGQYKERIDTSNARVKEIETALQKIPSCTSVVDGDCPSIAHKAIKGRG